ncbi:hypothetical protein RCL1_002612 [Eukaryota sp. TZLM3-RCL]
MLPLYVIDADEPFKENFFELDESTRIGGIFTSKLKINVLDFRMYTFDNIELDPQQPGFFDRFPREEFPQNWLQRLKPVNPRCMAKSLPIIGKVIDGAGFRVLVYKKPLMSQAQFQVAPFGIPSIVAPSSVQGTKLKATLDEIRFNDDALPPSLLFKPFAVLLNSCLNTKHPSAINSLTIGRSTRDLLNLSSMMFRFWDNENDYKSELVGCLNAFVERTGCILESEYGNIDFNFSVRGSHSNVPILLGEVKTRSYAGDELGQALINYAKLTTKQRPNCNHPCLLMTIRGYYLSVYAVIVSGAFFRYELMFSLNLLLIATDNPYVITYAQQFDALFCTLRELVNHHKSTSPGHLSRFPFFQFEHDKVEYLSCTNRHSFKAKWKSCDVIVKFYRTYNVDAHKLLHDNNMAPDILFHGSQLSWIIVIERDLTNLGYEKVSLLDDFPMDKVSEQAKLALEILHGRNFVHGDYRTTNWFWNGNTEHFLVIDYEFSGIHEQDRYPLFINIEHVPFHKDVGPLELLSKSHDLNLLEKFVANDADTRTTPSKKRTEEQTIRMYNDALGIKTPADTQVTGTKRTSGKK